VLQVTPTLPETFQEEILLEVAHFEPTCIPIRGEGTYPTLSLTLPRVPDETWAETLRGLLSAEGTDRYEPLAIPSLLGLHL
jgi:hypothetical protein